MFLLAALLSSNADAAQVHVHHKPVVVATPNVTITIGHGPAVHHAPVRPHKVPCRDLRHLPPHKRPQRCR